MNGNFSLWVGEVGNTGPVVLVHAQDLNEKFVPGRFVSVVCCRCVCMRDIRVGRLGPVAG